MEHPDRRLPAEALIAYARLTSPGGDAVSAEALSRGLGRVAMPVARPGMSSGEIDQGRPRGPAGEIGTAGDAASPGPGARAAVRILLDTGLFAEVDGGVALAPPYRPYTEYFRRQAHRVDVALRLAADTVPPGVPADIWRGAALFNAGLFFECHEHFEGLWRGSVPPAREFYHGLVQAAAGCYHVEKGNAHGAAVLLGKALGKLEAYRPAYLGVDVTALIESLEGVRAAAPRGSGTSRLLLHGGGPQVGPQDAPASRGALPYAGPAPALRLAAHGARAAGTLNRDVRGQATRGR